MPQDKVPFPEVLEQETRATAVLDEKALAPASLKQEALAPAVSESKPANGLKLADQIRTIGTIGTIVMASQLPRPKFKTGDYHQKLGSGVSGMWHRLAPELRRMILQLLAKTRRRGSYGTVPYFGFNGDLPPFLVAFRDVYRREAYDSALELFRDSVIWEVEFGDTTTAFEGLHPEEVAGLKHIEITPPRFLDELTRPVQRSRDFSQQFLQARSVETVDFSPIYRMENGAEAIRLITEWPRWMRGFTNLKSFKVEMAYPDGKFFDKKPFDDTIDTFLNDLDDHLDVKSKWDDYEWKDFGFIRHYGAFSYYCIVPREKYGSTGEDAEVRDIDGKVNTWSWTAEAGKTMDLSGLPDLEWDATDMSLADKEAEKAACIERWELDGELLGRGLQQIGFRWADGRLEYGHKDPDSDEEEEPEREEEEEEVVEEVEEKNEAEEEEMLEGSSEDEHYDATDANKKANVTHRLRSRSRR